MLVKFSCGCIGLVNVPGGEEGRNEVVLKPCDLPSDCWPEDICIYRRDLSDKTYTPLEADKAAELIGELAKLVSEGYALRQVKGLLGR